MTEDLEKFIGEKIAALPRKAIPEGQKETVWLKVQNHIRQTRLAMLQSREAAQQQIQGHRLWPVFRFGKMVIFTLVVILAIAVLGGATKASEGSLPGDTLYTVKKAAESVEKALATSDEAKVKVGIKHAKRRLEEVQILVAEKKENKIVTDTLQDLQSTTEQVINAASAAQPELKDNAVNFVTEETKILDSVKDQVEGDVKQAVQDTIAVNQESVNKLKDAGTGQEVKGTATDDTKTPGTPATSPQLRKPKAKDGVLESGTQIHGVTKITEPDSNSETTEPEILPEPTLGF